MSAPTIVAPKPFVTTVTELEEWLESTGLTTVITYRKRNRPTYAVRLFFPARSCAGEDYAWHGFSDSLSVALHDAIDRYLRDDHRVI